MKTLQITLGLLLISSLFAFDLEDYEHEKFIGTYGHKASYAIIINPDMTFTYIDNTNNKNISISGKWEYKGKEIHLKSNSRSKIRSKWTLINKDSCLKSKKGFTYYTLCRNCD
ncbi:hypothetical protein [Brumimicrobium sp.]|uniref:hypothetical protein n=1 Tax=Brumimicrobium sp. TaxID=2029867 RepID=UPI0026082B78|nr:hypothetical protein [uncultured Brumimicrobium sp.]